MDTQKIGYKRFYCLQSSVMLNCLGKLTTIHDVAKERQELYALGNRDNVPAMGGGVILMLKIHLIKWVSLPFLCKWMDKQAWEELTGKELKSAIAISFLDNIVYSAPGVSTGPIPRKFQIF
jgi:hypothetical protein